MSEVQRTSSQQGSAIPASDERIGPRRAPVFGVSVLSPRDAWRSSARRCLFSLAPAAALLQHDFKTSITRSAALRVNRFPTFARAAARRRRLRHRVNAQRALRVIFLTCRARHSLEAARPMHLVNARQCSARRVLSDLSRALLARWRRCVRNLIDAQRCSERRILSDFARGCS